MLVDAAKYAWLGKADIHNVYKQQATSLVTAMTEAVENDESIEPPCPAPTSQRVKPHGSILEFVHFRFFRMDGTFEALSNQIRTAKMSRPYFI